MNLLKALNWRYATKKFDPSRKVTEADLQHLLEAVRLSASSYGLQAYKVLVVEDPAIREKLVGFSWGQRQVADASHLLVFCAYTDMNDAMIDEYLDLKSKTQDIPLKMLKGYGDFMKNKMRERTREEITHWNIHQAYIALGSLLAACGELNIDSCPMEGFEAEQYDEILEIKERGLTTVVLVPIGYRSEEDASQFSPKVRKPIEALVERIG